MSKKSIYTPATIKKDFNLRIYCKLKNLFYICYIDHLIISTNSSLSNCSYNHYKGFTCRLQVLFAAGAGVFLFFLCVLLFFLKSKPFGIVIECIFKLFTCKCESISICITIGI